MKVFVIEISYPGFLIITFLNLTICFCCIQDEQAHPFGFIDVTFDGKTLLEFAPHLRKNNNAKN